MQGKIIKIVSNDCTVLSDNKSFICKPRGKFRKDNLIPLASCADEKYKDNPYVLKVDEQTGERYFCPDKMPIDILKTDSKTISVNETEEFKKSFYYKQRYSALENTEINNNFTINEEFISEFKMEELGGYNISDFVSFNKDLNTLDLYYGFKNSIVRYYSIIFYIIRQ